MYKIFFSVLILSFSFLNVYASENITRGDAFIFFADKIDEAIPDSYTYIDLYYTGINESSKVGRALQKLVYLGLINNTKSNLGLQQDIDFQLFEGLAIKILHLKLASQISIEQKKNLYVTEDDLITLNAIFQEQKQKTEKNIISKGDSRKSKILTDVYDTLQKSHYDRNSFNEDQLITGAIKGATDSIGDKYTTYFPPVESQNFNENLDGNFEGIGAYIEMPTPGELIIISPIVGSPAENAGIKGGDKIIMVDNKEITDENTLNEVISWIKGPKGTTVELTIIRESIPEAFTLTVTRDTIIIKDVEHKKLSQNTYYIQIKSFGNNVTTEFKEALTEIQSDKGIRKIIFDVRNNPGGYLDEVAYMLSYFVPEGESTAIIDYGNYEKEYKSRGYNIIDTSKYEFVFLQNGGSASASEIMVGTMKDYFPEMTIIGEKSFGKGSVQSLKNYFDGSTLKYTSAKWFTGKTKTGIDGIGISPDIELELNIEALKNNEYDNQLERAKRN